MRKRSRRREKLTVAHLEHTLPFASNVAAFEYACRFILNDVKAGLPIAALVLDASPPRFTDPGKTAGMSGVQTALLRVHARDGGFQVVAQTAGPIGPALLPGDLVAWRPERFNQPAAARNRDPRLAWVGRIVAVLEPEWKDGAGWKVREPFR